jgi:hypothetical protein
MFCSFQINLNKGESKATIFQKPGLNVKESSESLVLKYLCLTQQNCSQSYFSFEQQN